MTYTYPHKQPGVTIYHDRTQNNFRIVWRDIRDNRRRQARRADEADAHAVAASVRHQIANAHHVRATRSTASFGTLIDAYLDPTSHDQPWTVDYQARQQSIIRNWIRPQLGQLRCDQIETQHLRTVVHSARQAGRQESTVQGIAATLAGIIKVGRETGHIGSTVVFGQLYKSRGVRTAGQSRGFVDPRTVPPADEVSRLADYMGDRYENWRTLQVLLSAYAGPRLGEQTALRGRDVDLDSMAVNIVRSWHDKAGTYGPPKWDKVRTTLLPASLVPLAKERLSQLSSPDDLLFPGPSGGPHVHGSFHRTRFGPARTHLGWPRSDTVERRWMWSWHSLRHFFCTWALASAPEGLGLDVADVAYFAGHHSPSFTFERYVSRRAGSLERAAVASRKLAGAGA